MGVESIEQQTKPAEDSTIEERIVESQEEVKKFQKDNSIRVGSDNLNGSRAWEYLRRRFEKIQ